MVGTSYTEYGTRYGKDIHSWRNILRFKDSICPGTVAHAEKQIEELEEEERQLSLGIGAMMDTHFITKRFMNRK